MWDDAEISFLARAPLDSEQVQIWRVFAVVIATAGYVLPCAAARQ